MFTLSYINCVTVRRTGNCQFIINVNLHVS